MLHSNHCSMACEPACIAGMPVGPRPDLCGFGIGDNVIVGLIIQALPIV